MERFFWFRDLLLCFERERENCEVTFVVNNLQILVVFDPLSIQKKFVPKSGKCARIWRLRQSRTMAASIPSIASPIENGIPIAMPTNMVNLNPTCSTASTKLTMKHPIPPMPVINLNRMRVIMVLNQGVQIFLVCFNWIKIFFAGAGIKP